MTTALGPLGIWGSARPVWALMPLGALGVRDGPMCTENHRAITRSLPLAPAGCPAAAAAVASSAAASGGAASGGAAACGAAVAAGAAGVGGGGEVVVRALVLLSRPARPVWAVV
eukprot:3127446-Prymnesium_polylepis.1